MKTIKARNFAVCVALGTLTVANAGCSADPKQPKSTECTPIPGVESCAGNTAGSGDEAGDTETGGTETGGLVESLAPGECRHNVSEEISGWRYQCEGHLYASIEFDLLATKTCDDVLGDQCDEHHVFGPSNDLYESPDVMACCGEYAPEFKDTYLEFCSYDVVQQVCISTATRLAKLINDGSFSGYETSATALQNWIADNYTNCFASMLANDSDPDPDEIVSYWEVPDDIKWTGLTNFVVSIDSGTISTGVFLPASQDDWLACNGAQDNNDEVFEGAGSPGGITSINAQLSSSLEGTLAGPEVLGGSVSGRANFGPACAAKGCSSLELFVDSYAQEVEVLELELLTDSFTLTNGTSDMVIDSARINLFDSVIGQVDPDPAGSSDDYLVDPGEAHFLLAGTSGGLYDHFMAWNSTELVLHEQPDGSWTAGAFEIEYVDDNGELWTITLASSSWN